MHLDKESKITQAHLDLMVHWYSTMVHKILKQKDFYFKTTNTNKEKTDAHANKMKTLWA